MTLHRRSSHTILLLLLVLFGVLCGWHVQAQTEAVSAMETDDSAPTVSIKRDSCMMSATVIFTDSLVTDAGIKTVTVREQFNCSVTLDTSRTPALVTAVVTILDPQSDAVYALEVADKSGNARYVRDTLQGFTLHFFPAQNSFIYSDVVQTQQRCDSILLYNTGLLPYTITGVRYTHNTIFSAPLSQFPLTLAPGDSVALLVCFSPAADTLYDDTLFVWQHCRSVGMPLHGRGIHAPISTFSDVRCGIRIHLDNSEQALSSPALYPNPANDRTTLRFSLVNPSLLTLRIINNMGLSTMELPPTHYTDGNYTIELDTSHLGTGFYFCELTSDTTHTLLPLHIIH